MSETAFVRLREEPVLPPPLFSRGALAWARANLFSSWASSLTTALMLAFLLWQAPPLIE